ncbi:hypothetical protein ACLOJK_039728 [Asimina triloba]
MGLNDALISRWIWIVAVDLPPTRYTPAGSAIHPTCQLVATAGAVRPALPRRYRIWDGQPLACHRSRRRASAAPATATVRACECRPCRRLTHQIWPSQLAKKMSRRPLPCRRGASPSARCATGSAHLAVEMAMAAPPRRPDLPARHRRDRARRPSSPGLLFRAGMGKMPSVHHAAVAAGWEEDGFVMWVMEHRNRCSGGALGYGIPAEGI